MANAMAGAQADIRCVAILDTTIYINWRIDWCGSRCNYSREMRAIRALGSCTYSRNSTIRAAYKYMRTEDDGHVRILIRVNYFGVCL